MKFYRIHVTLSYEFSTKQSRYSRDARYFPIRILSDGCFFFFGPELAKRRLTVGLARGKFAERSPVKPIGGRGFTGMSLIDVKVRRSGTKRDDPAIGIRG